MGRAGITYSEVARAANELIETDQMPTIEKIRTKIGSGSYTTIAAHLKKWKAEHPTDQLAKTEGIPPSLITTIKEIWKQLTEQADQRCQEIQSAANEQIATEQNLRVKAEKNAQRLEQAHQDIKEQFIQLTEQHNTLQNQFKQCNQTLKERDATVDHLNDTINTHQSENKRLHALVDKVHNNLEHFQNTTAKQRQQEQLVFIEEKTKLEHQINSISEKFQMTEKSYDQEVQQNISVTEQLKITTHKLELQEKEVQKYQNELTNLNNYINDVQQENQTNSALLKREKEMSISLQKHNDQLLKANTKLITKIEKLNHTKQNKKSKITEDL